MLVMADKVSNLRSIAADNRAIGDILWERFNAPFEKQAWYYSGIQDSLWDMQFDPDAAPTYWEMVGLYKDIFVKYYREFCPPGYYEDYLLQVCADGSIYRLDKGNPEWKRVDDSPEEIALSCEELLRKDAEALEDEWNKPFWECIDRDLYAGTCKLIGTNERTAEIEIFNRKLTLNGEDYGSACKSINGEEEYEYHVSLDEDNTKRLIVQIRREFGIDETLREVFQRAFGDSIISTRMMEYCRNNKIEYAFINY